MSRWTLILDRPDARAKAAQWCMKAPVGMRVEFKETKRTLDQNSRLWAMLTGFAKHWNRFPCFVSNK